MSCQKDEDYTNGIPEVTTGYIKNIKGSTADGGGSFITGFNTSVSSFGLCYGLNKNPVISDSISGGLQISVAIKGNYREEVFTCELTGLIPDTTYFVKAFVVNSAGTGYGSEVSFVTLPLEVGQSYGGGIIFYLNETGKHGLIAVANDQSDNSQWFNGAIIRTGATGSSIGDGEANTNLIVNSLGEGNYAASFCYNLELNGYSDWFLPSKDELNLMFLHKDLIGGFSDDFYWSSTELGEGSAWEQVFNTGAQYFVNKNSQIRVRAIRAF